MPQSWDAKYFDGKSPQSMLVRIQLLPKGVMLHFMDGRSQHWKHESFSIVRDRESGPIRLLRGDFPQETLEIPDQGFASVLEQKGLSGKGWRTSWKQKSISVFAAIVLFSGTTWRNGPHSAFSESANMLNPERGQGSGNAHAFPDYTG